VEETQQKLLRQCNGDIRAVSAKYSTSHLFIHWTNKILMKGICVKSEFDLILSHPQKSPRYAGLIYSQLI